jgi:aminobenzoyl-glutamate utilization protein A
MALRAKLIERIDELAADAQPHVVAWRRDLHRHAESAWTEFRTASLVARQLADLGYAVRVGQEVISAAERMGLPTSDKLESCWQRALLEGGDPEFLEPMRDGYTGVVGMLSHEPGPVIGLRFDMDALDTQESMDQGHLPADEGFASIHENVMHACGHDAHTAVGLAVAGLLVELGDSWQGAVKLIFQPAEEGVRGAKSMVAAGVVDDVGYLLGHHFYSNWETGEIAPGMGGYLATTKFDATFTGRAAHAGSSPQEGRNALLAAATAVLNLYAIPRHRQGVTRINVGQLSAGTARNVICPSAHLAMETRGSTTELNDYMYWSAVRILEAAGAMHDCKLEIALQGSAQSARSSPELASRVARMAAQLGLAIRPPEDSSGSEDVTYMMQRVQERGGEAVSIGFGAGRPGLGHHTPTFDIDESALQGAIRLLVAVTLDLFQPA